MVGRRAAGARAERARVPAPAGGAADGRDGRQAEHDGQQQSAADRQRGDGGVGEPGLGPGHRLDRDGGGRPVLVVARGAPGAFQAQPGHGAERVDDARARQVVAPAADRRGGGDQPPGDLLGAQLREAGEDQGGGAGDLGGGEAGPRLGPVAGAAGRHHGEVLAVGGQVDPLGGVRGLHGRAGAVDGGDRQHPVVGGGVHGLGRVAVALVAGRGDHQHPGVHRPFDGFAHRCAVAGDGEGEIEDGGAGVHGVVDGGGQGLETGPVHTVGDPDRVDGGVGGDAGHPIPLGAFGGDEAGDGGAVALAVLFRCGGGALEAVRGRDHDVLAAGDDGVREVRVPGVHAGVDDGHGHALAGGQVPGLAQAEQVDQRVGAAVRQVHAGDLLPARFGGQGAAGGAGRGERGQGREDEGGGEGEERTRPPPGRRRGAAGYPVGAGHPGLPHTLRLSRVV